MKKLIYILFLLPFFAIGQVSNGTEFEQEAFRATNNQTVTTSDFITTTGADGTQGKILGENISLSVIPPVSNFTPTTPNIKGYFQGVDNAIGDIVFTTAGISTRVWFTADVTVVSAINYYATNALNKGTLASAIQNVTNNDNEKKYFAQDLMGSAFVSATIFPAGVYAGNLSASTSPNSAQQRYTVELYKCNNAGTPIASGITGAPVGSLGVTVIVILDSGLLTLADGSVTNVPVSGNLASPLSMAVGERIRYHVSAEKVGTAGNNITQSVYYGTSYNSYLDVPVPLNTTAVQNLSTVTGATTTDAFNTLNTTKANDADVLHKSGNETKTGTLTATSFIKSGATTTDALLAGGGTLANPISGTGTTDYLPTFTGAGVIGNSEIFRLSSGVYKLTGVNSNPSFNISNSGTSGYPVIQLENIKSGITKFWNLEVSRAVHGDLGFTNAGGQLITFKENGFAGFGTTTPLNRVQSVGSVFDKTMENTYSARFSQFGSPNDQGVVIGYNNSTNIGYINCINPIIAWTSLSLVSQGGNLLVGKDSDNGVDKGQFNGTVSGSPATLSNQFVTLSQVNTYKSYIAYFNQSGTSAPVPNIVYNTIGSIVWTRTATGTYLGTLSGAFTLGKTVVMPINGFANTGQVISASKNDINSVSLRSFLAGTLTDGIMGAVYEGIEIRVYP